MPAHKTLVGQTINNIIVLRESHIDRKHAYHYSCQCYCGNVFTVAGDRLRRGSTRSCGCRVLKRQHGQVGTTEYGIWAAMKRRCLLPTATAYADYGGRGIKVCERWMDFQNFLADMGPRPEDMSLNRTDNDGNYEPGNCEWSTHEEQSNNRRNNVLLTFNGETLNTTQWATRLGIKKATLKARIDKGWPVEKALSTPTRPMLTSKLWARSNLSARKHTRTV